MSNKTLNIVIPMAGHGSRFTQAGYTLPKPLIPIHGIPLIQWVIHNLRPTQSHRFIFLCQSGHIRDYSLDKKLQTWAPGSIILTVDQVTEGAACTVLLAHDLINTTNPLMIANCDQYVDTSIDDYLAAMSTHHGLIMTMTADDPKWSFVGFDEAGKVNRVVEKEVISNEATVGLYNFAQGQDFVRAASQMIAKNLRVNGEFYVAPVYNELIAQGLSIGTCSIGSDRCGMYGLGTPNDLEDFATLPLSLSVKENFL